jgi:hypothetical protein
MFKRSLVILLATAAGLSLLACGGGKEEDALEDESAPATSTASAPSAAAPAAASAPAAGGATVTGKVAFAGTAPANESIKMDADAYCKAAHAARSTRRT